MATEMNAINILKADHDRFKDSLKRYEKENDEEKKQKILNELMQDIKIHEQMEEQVFYPELKKQSSSEKTKEMVREGKEEHHVVDFLMDEIQHQKLSAPKLHTKVHVMGESLEHHLKEEEVRYFPSFLRCSH